MTLWLENGIELDGKTIAVFLKVVHGGLRVEIPMDLPCPPPAELAGRIVTVEGEHFRVTEAVDMGGRGERIACQLEPAPAAAPAEQEETNENEHRKQRGSPGQRRGKSRNQRG